MPDLYFLGGWTTIGTIYGPEALQKLVLEVSKVQRGPKRSSEYKTIAHDILQTILEIVFNKFQMLQHTRGPNSVRHECSCVITDLMVTVVHSGTNAHIRLCRSPDGFCLTDSYSTHVLAYTQLQPQGVGPWAHWDCHCSKTTGGTPGYVRAGGGSCLKTVTILWRPKTDSHLHNQLHEWVALPRDRARSMHLSTLPIPCAGRLPAPLREVVS